MASITLCVPCVAMNINRDHVYRTFHELALGRIERVDLVVRPNKKGERLQRAFIHYKTWNTDDVALRAKEILDEGKNIKVFYNDPWFWKVSTYRKPEREG